MSTTAHIGQHRRVRVLNGPRKGQTFPIRGLLKIGRGRDAHVQLFENGVSRRHAQIRRTPNGRDQLEDLESTNGTMLDEIRIRRQLLAPRMVFTVWKTRFIYEDISAEPSEADASALRPVDTEDPRVHRATVAYPLRQLRLVGSSPSGPGRDPDAPLPRHRRPASESADPADAPALELVVDERAPTYPGDLVGDILDYRSLRGWMLEGELLGAERLERLGWLEQRLRCEPTGTQDGPEKRAFVRYSFSAAAELRLGPDEGYVVSLVELGADGARLHAPGHRLDRGMQVRLWLEISRSGRPTTVALRAKVAWTEHAHAGIQFEQVHLVPKGASGEAAAHFTSSSDPNVVDPRPGTDRNSTSRWPEAL